MKMILAMAGIIALLALQACAGDPKAGVSDMRDPAMSQAGKAREPRHIPGQLLIRFKDHIDPVSAEKLLLGHGARILTRYEDPRLFHVKLPDGLDVETGLRQFGAMEEVAYAEPNQIYSTQELKQ